MTISIARRHLLVLAIVLWQPAVHTQVTQCPIDVIFLIDSSGSITENMPYGQEFANWNMILDFVSSFINEIEISYSQAQIAAVSFSNNADIQWGLTEYQTKDQLLDQVKKINYIGGTTNHEDAFRTAIQMYREPNLRASAVDVVILITDGNPTVPEPMDLARRRALEAVADLKQIASVFAVGVTDAIDADFLRDMSSDPQELNKNYFTEPNFSTLQRVLPALLDSACSAVTALVPTPSISPDCSSRVDLVFVMDQSGSITWNDPNNWDLMKTFIVEISHYFYIHPDYARVGLVLFSDNAYVQFRLNQYTDAASLEAAIMSLQHQGGQTNIPAALDTMTMQAFNSAGDRSDVKNIGMVITDGKSTSSGVTEHAEAAKNMGIEMFSIGVTTEINMTELNDIASDPDSTHVFLAQNFQDLSVIVNQVTQGACDVLETSPPTTTTTTTTTTRPPSVSGCYGSMSDIVFVVDTSGSIKSANFQKVLNFLSEVVKKLDVESGRVRVGMETFSDGTVREFNLNQYTSRTDIVNAINAVQYRRGKTNTAGALSFCRTNMFTSSNGDRGNAQNIAIVITDGESNDARSTFEEARKLKDAGTLVISIGIGNWLDLYELKAMASYPVTTNMIHVDSFNSINNIVDTIRDAICDNVNECSSNPCRNGICQNGIRFYWCQCYSGWAGKNCETPCTTTGDVIFAVDASGSVGPANFDKMMTYLTSVIERLDVDNGQNQNSGTRIGMVRFANNAVLQFQLNTYMDKTSILDALYMLYTGGTTNTADVIRYAREQMFTGNNGDRSNVANYLVILTDGRSNNADDTWRQAMAARNAGITIIAVAIGGNLDITELQAVASEPVDNNIIKVENFDNLPRYVQPLGEALCDTNNECQSNPCRNGAQCTDLINGYTCGPCPNGYTGRLCERSCTGIIDLLLLLDSSGSIRNERFPKVKEFLMGIIDELDVGQDRTRVGLAYWSNSATIGFDLNTYYTKQDIKTAIWKIPFMGDRTNTASALQTARQTMLTSSRGARDNADDYAIIVTDGNSNINPENTIVEALKGRLAGLHYTVIAVGGFNRIELEGIASLRIQDNLYAMSSINNLPGYKNNIIAAVCNDQNECNSNPCRNNGQCVDQVNRYECVCQYGWSSYNCDRRCNVRYDVTLVLDLSGSMDAEYDMTLAFAQQMAYGLPLESNQVQMAVVAYADNVLSFFYLNAYDNRKDIIDALHFYPKGGSTNTPQALSVMRNDIFNPSHGDRSSERNIAIVVSDGQTTVNKQNTINEANYAKNQGIEFYAIATGDGPDLSEMGGIATDSNHLFRLRNENEASSIASQVLGRICQ